MYKVRRAWEANLSLITWSKASYIVGAFLQQIYLIFMCFLMTCTHIPLQVTLRHSLKRAGPDNYDFRRNGVISPESLSVYEIVVQNEQQPLVLNVLLEVTRVLNSQYPVAAVVLIW